MPYTSWNFDGTLHATDRDDHVEFRPLGTRRAESWRPLALIERLDAMAWPHQLPALSIAASELSWDALACPFHDDILQAIKDLKPAIDATIDNPQHAGQVDRQMHRIATTIDRLAEKQPFSIRRLCMQCVPTISHSRVESERGLPDWMASPESVLRDLLLAVVWTLPFEDGVDPRTADADIDREVKLRLREQLQTIEREWTQQLPTLPSDEPWPTRPDALVAFITVMETSPRAAETPDHATTARPLAAAAIRQHGLAPAMAEWHDFFDPADWMNDLRLLNAAAALGAPEAPDALRGLMQPGNADRLHRVSAALLTHDAERARDELGDRLADAVNPGVPLDWSLALLELADHRNVERDRVIPLIQRLAATRSVAESVRITAQRLLDRWLEQPHTWCMACRQPLRAADELTEDAVLLECTACGRRNLLLPDNCTLPDAVAVSVRWPSDTRSADELRALRQLTTGLQTVSLAELRRHASGPETPLGRFAPQTAATLLVNGRRLGLDIVVSESGQRP